MNGTPRWLSPGAHLLVGAALILFVSACRREAPAAAAAASEAPPKEDDVTKAKKEPVFEPQVAGAFYPAEAEALRKQIQRYLDEAQKAGRAAPGDLLGIIVPHAGYPYSGPVAAFGFQAAKAAGPYRRVVVLGPAHRQLFAQPALLDAPAYRTPLGDIPIDREGVAALAATGAAKIDPGRFYNEHALEVELPFLQVALGDFSLVPVMLSQASPDSARRLAEAIRKVFPDKDTLVVASTDMSHDYPYELAVALDENGLRYLKGLDAEGLWKAYQAFERAEPRIQLAGGKPEPDCTQFCGMGPVLTLVELARLFGDASATVLDRRNSGDIVGDKKSRIVGYATVAFTLAKPRPEGGGPAAGKKAGAHVGSTGDFLNDSQKKRLLEIARQAFESYVRDKQVKDFEVRDEKLLEPGAAFVTLTKSGELRGCIGHMEPTDPLWRMVRDRAIDAAVHDPRFRPVTPSEIPDIHIEISVLSPRIPVKDPRREIVIGRDGVWLELGMARGVFLPQVPVEQGWTTVEEYLDHLCQKAGVYERGCWKASGAKIMRFTALVFGEGEVH
ncbi:MAG: AmmeMemoRadiSam system protein B [Myxococcales bacterium]|nr:AmmeMemoRadiSam system protein B [Myxococcales bacterium]